jgi:hypothetical protein
MATQNGSASPELASLAVSLFQSRRHRCTADDPRVASPHSMNAVSIVVAARSIAQSEDLLEVCSAESAGEGVESALIKATAPICASRQLAARARCVARDATPPWPPC